MRKIWNWIVKKILAVPQDKRLHFVAGLILSAFFAISLGMKVCIIPAIIAAFVKEFFDKWTAGEWEWMDLLATVLGGLVPQVFVLLGVWWFPPVA